MAKQTTGKAKQKVASLARSAQGRFLALMAGERRHVTIFLVNGIRLEGRITSFDEHVILLEGEKTDHVYKHAVSTIQPAADAAPKAKRSTRDKPARSTAGADEYAAHDVEHAAPRSAAEKPRQPVVVIRPKRRSIKSADKS